LNKSSINIKKHKNYLMFYLKPQFLPLINVLPSTKHSSTKLLFGDKRLVLMS